MRLRELPFIDLGFGLPDATRSLDTVDASPEVGIDQPVPGRHWCAVAEQGRVLYHHGLAVGAAHGDLEVPCGRPTKQRREERLVVCTSGLVLRPPVVGGLRRRRQRQNSRACSMRASMPELGGSPARLPLEDERGGAVVVVVVVVAPPGGSSEAADGATGPVKPGSPE